MKEIVGIGHAPIRVAEKRVLNRANATLIDRNFTPLGMGFCVVDGNAQDLDATLFELTDTVVKGDQLRRSHEGEILRVEEKDDVAALVV